MNCSVLFFSFFSSVFWFLLLSLFFIDGCGLIINCDDDDDDGECWSLKRQTWRALNNEKENI